MPARRLTVVLVVIITAYSLSGCGSNEATPVVAGEVEASLCQAAFTASVGEGKPRAPVVMYKQSEWEGEEWVLYTHPLVPAAIEGGEPQTMVCIRETRRDISESYYAGSDHVYKLNWDIRVVLLPGGNVIAAGRSDGDSVRDNEVYVKPNVEGGAHVYGDPPIIELLGLIAPALDRIIVTGQSIEAIAFSPDGRTLVSAGLAPNPVPRLSIWDLETGELAVTFEDADGFINCVAFAPDGKSLAITSSQSGVGLWDTNTGELLQEVSGYADFLTYSPDGTLLVGTDQYDGVIFWDPIRGEELHYMDIRSGDKIAFSPDGKILAVEVEEAILFFDPNSYAEITSITTESPYDPAFSPDGKWLASNYPLVLWDAVSLQVVRTLGEGWDFAFSPDNRLIAQLSGEYEAVHIWDVATGEKLDTLTITTNWGWVDMGEFKQYFTPYYPWLAFSPDGKWLATWGGEEGTIRLWDMSKYHQP